MHKENKKIKNILEALPYIQQFRNKIFVFKYGGSLLTDPIRRESFVKDIILLKHLNMKIIVVHGGGKRISKRLNDLNIKSEFYKGYRKTSKKAMKEIEMVLSGEINNELVLDFVNKGEMAVGLSGKDSGMIKAKRKKISLSEDIGSVGEIIGVNKNFLEILLESEYIPVISPIGYDEEGKTLNINADDVASAIASSVKAEKLFFISDVKGFYLEYGNKNSFISTMKVEESKKLISKGKIEGGMLPKIKACIKALDSGVSACHIIDGREEHSVLLEIFTKSGIGTMIKGGNYEFDEYL